MRLCGFLASSESFRVSGMRVLPQSGLVFREAGFQRLWVQLADLESKASALFLLGGRALGFRVGLECQYT